MIRNEREKIRDKRKQSIIKAFAGNEKLFTNEVARKINIVWQVADGLLVDLVKEGRLTGDKINGYQLPTARKERKSLREKIKSLFHL